MTFQTGEDRQFIECYNVRISNDAISEMVDDRPAIEIEKKDINKIELVYGISSERPLIQLMFGVALTLWGLFPLRLILYWLIEGGKLYGYQVLIVAVLPIGLWLVRGAIRKSYFLSVESSKGRRKIVFNGKLLQEQLYDFLKMANDTWDYRILYSHNK